MAELEQNAIQAQAQEKIFEKIIIEGYLMPQLL